MRPALWLAVTLALAAAPLLAELGYKPAPKAVLALELASAPDADGRFEVRGRVEARVGLRRLRVSLQVPAGLELVEGWKAARPRLAAGERLPVTAKLRLARPVDGAELKLVARFQEDGLVAADELTVARTIFFSGTADDAGEGPAGSFWRRYTRPPASGLPRGYVLEDCGPISAGTEATADRRLAAEYAGVLEQLERGQAARAASALEALAGRATPGMQAGVRNALAVARAAAGDELAARASWGSLLQERALETRPAAYIQYNLAVLALKLAQKDRARRHLEQALERHSGFRLARRLLDGLAFGR